MAVPKENFVSKYTRGSPETSCIEGRVSLA